ncbi:MAG: hypothetical protein BHW64_01780 [Candidatus Melainabacteria bacterium LEY3_CP_29_8]|nr:MAG: hypothetical protein BHW64_01780 [Candidatus Melainabacteria bacterium LEY3_CP_29_8]
MVTKRNSKVTVNGVERLVDIERLSKLAEKYISEIINKNKFVDEVIFRISDLEFDEIDTNGKSIEEYYFAACLAYIEENGIDQFLNEEDDMKIFEYCGAELK